MLLDYTKVIDIMRALDAYVLERTNHGLAEIDIGSSKSILVKLYKASNYVKNVKYGLTTYSNIDVDISRDISHMTYDDIMNFINMVHVSQMGDFIIIHYDELKCWKNPFVTKRTMYDVYSGILRECRGIVIDIRTFRLISIPYYKFMNMGEMYAEYSEQDILDRMKNAHSIEFAEKMDGSLIQITWLSGDYSFYPYDCLLASSNTLKDAHILHLSRDWYQNNSNYQQLVRDYADWTVLFEAVFSENKGIVEYAESDNGLWLIGMRNKITGELKRYSELQYIAFKYEVRVIKIFQGTYTELRHQLACVNGTQMEGYVGNLDGFLVKMKTMDYIKTVMEYRNGLSINGIIKAIDSKTFDDIVGSLADNQKDVASDIMRVYRDLLSARDRVYKILVESDLSYKGMQSAMSNLPSCLRCVAKALLDTSDKGRILLDIYLNHPFVKKIVGRMNKFVYYSLSELNQITNELSLFDMDKYQQIVKGIK